MIKKNAVSVINDFSGGQDTKTPILTMKLNKSPNMRNYHCAGVGNRLVKRGGFAKVNSSAVESDNLDVFYPPGYQTKDYAVRDAAARTQVSQGFKCATSSTVTKVKLWLKKTSTPTGNINVEIQTNSSGVPSKTAVTNGTSSNVDVSTLASTYGWITFTFSTNPTLVAGTQYHLVVQGSNTINGIAYPEWGSDDYDLIYQDGSMSVYDATTWVSESTFDACFEIYITGGAAGNDGVAIWDFSSKNMMLGIFGTALYKMDKNSSGTPDGTWDNVLGGSSWESYTKTASHFDGADAATAYTDPIAGAYTFVGTAQLDTAQKKFGTASLLLDGDSDYVTLPHHADNELGTGDFTIDVWVRFSDLTNSQVIMGKYVSGTTEWRFIKQTNANSNKLVFDCYVSNVNKGTYTMTNAWAGCAVDTWYHLAFVRSGTGAYVFIDGVSQPLTEGQAFSTNDLTLGSGNLAVGVYSTTTNFLDGWVDEVRLSKGIARHTANFTPPTSAYSAGSFALTSSRYWTFADWQSGRALINTDIGLYTYTGTGNASAVSGAPIGKFIVIWKEYVFSAGIRGSPNTVRYCDFQDYTTWTASQTLNFDTNDGDIITGIRILKGKLYVFKRYSIHRVSYLGSSPTFQIDQIVGIGTPSHYSIKEVDLGGDIGTVLVFLTTDKKLAIFDGYNIQIINDTLTEESNDLFGSADDQPISFSDMDFNYSDLFHATVKGDTFEYILYCVLSGDTSVKYAFVFDFRTGGVYPYDGQIFSSSTYTMSTSKIKKLYCAGYAGLMFEVESGNSDNGSAINAYWVSGKMKANAVSLRSKALQLALYFKEVSSSSTINLSFQYRLDWNTSWTTAETTNFNRGDDYAYGKTQLFDIGTIENMFQVKISDDSSNPASTIFGLDLFGEPLGVSTSDRATA